MKTARIPLVGNFSQRGLDGDAALAVPEDQRFLNATWNVVTNPVTGKSTVYVEKRPGWGVDSYIPAQALNLPGAAGDYASTPDSAALDITGDIDIRVHLAANDWTPTNNQRLVYKRNVSPSYDFYIVQTAGNLGFYDGTTTYVSTVPGFVDGSRHWVRVTRATATGTATFYTSEEGTTWAQLGDPVTGASGNLPVTTSDLYIGSDNGTSFFVGKIYEVQILNGIGGTVVASFKAEDQVPGIATITSSTTGEVYTLNGNASITTSGNAAITKASTGIIKPQAFNASLTAFGDSNSTIYFGTTSLGVITGRALHFAETLISSVAHVVIRSSDGTGWYYADGAKDVTAYTMDGNNSTTVTDIKVAGVSSVSGLYVGQKLTASANIAAGSRIVSINAGAFSAVLSIITTGGAFNDLAVTKEPIAKIIDADYVATGTYISAFAPMDGYLFYADDSGYVNNSDRNSVTAYTANARIAVQQSPDPTVAVAIQKNTLIAFGLASNEKFVNAGFSVAPLQVSKTQVDHVGALDQRSITTLEDDIFFVSTPSEGDVGVYQMRGLQSRRVSTPNVDRIIGTAAANGAIYASSFRLGGYPYAAFFISTASDGPASIILQESGETILQENGDAILLEDTPSQTASYVRTLVYNAALNLWGEWDCDEATFIDSVGSGTANQLIATSRVKTDGKVYKIDPVSAGELYTDDGTAYSLQIRTAGLDFGTGKRKFVTEIVLIGDQQTAGTATLEASDDGFATWFTLGTFDLTLPEPKITRCGSHLGKRSYRLTHSYAGPFRAEALQIKYQEAA